MSTSLRHKFTKRCLALSLAFTTPIASAIPVNGFFEATVTESIDRIGLFGIFGVDDYRGMTIQVDFSYDTATAPGAIVVGPSEATYFQRPAATDWLAPTVTLNGVSHSDLDLSGSLFPGFPPGVPVPNFGQITLQNDNAGFDRFVLTYSQDTFPGDMGLPPNETFLWSVFQIVVTDFTETMLSSTDLPTSVNFTNPATFSCGIFETFLITTDASGTFSQLNSMASIKWGGTNPTAFQSLHINSVPIPAAFWLFGTALVGLVGFSRRRKAA